MNPDRLAELEEERRFLLGSLVDLEREREAGDVEDADYEALRDGYTARAATVLRNIERWNCETVLERPTLSPPRKIMLMAAIIRLSVSHAV